MHAHQGNEAPKQAVWHRGEMRQALQYLDMVLLEHGVDLGVYLEDQRKPYFLPLLNLDLSPEEVATEMGKKKARTPSLEHIRKMAMFIFKDAVAVAEWRLPEHEHHLIPKLSTKRELIPGSVRYDIVQLRKAAGLTQQQLGELVGKTKKVIATLETGKTHPASELIKEIYLKLGASEETADAKAMQYIIESAL